MNVELFSICDAATVSGGKLNILGIFDRIEVNSLPSKLPTITFVARIRFFPEDDLNSINSFKIVLVTHKENKDLLIVSDDIPPQVIVNNKGSAILIIIAQSTNLVIETDGKLEVKLILNDKVVFDLPLIVDIKE